MESLNAITSTENIAPEAETTMSMTQAVPPTIEPIMEFNGLPENTYGTENSVTPENDIMNNVTEKPVTPEANRTVGTLSEPIRHDTCTTTNEEEAVEALLALSVLPDRSTEQNKLYENEELMPIGAPNTGMDVNPVKTKLSTNDVNKAIDELPEENRFKPATTTPPAIDNNKTTDNSKKETSASDSPPTPISPTKGKLKVTKYGLWKMHHKKRSYKCQKCGKQEKSIQDLNEHHRCSHPPCCAVTATRSSTCLHRFSCTSIITRNRKLLVKHVDRPSVSKASL